MLTTPALKSNIDWTLMVPVTKSFMGSLTIPANKKKKTCSVQAGEEGGTGPLLSAKLHKSWIADVQLLPADGLSLHAAALPTLLTASNDGSVRLWDLSKGCEGMPLELAQTDDLHTGTAPACQAGSSASCSIAQAALVLCSQGKRGEA